MRCDAMQCNAIVYNVIQCNKRLMCQHSQTPDFNGARKQSVQMQCQAHLQNANHQRVEDYAIVGLVNNVEQLHAHWSGIHFEKPIAYLFVKSCCHNITNALGKNLARYLFQVIMSCLLLCVGIRNPISYL